VTEKLYAGSLGQPAENFALLDKIRIFLRIIYTLCLKKDTIQPPTISTIPVVV